MHRYLTLYLLPWACLVTQTLQEWQPVLSTGSFGEIKSLPGASSFTNLISHGVSPQSPNLQESSDQCQNYKIGFTQDLYFQYLQYKTNIPELKEFTLCFWSKFYNHSNDHPIFSYAVDGQPKAISSWVSNTERSSYFSLAVEGHTFFRLNYPLRLNRWYHTCQSWNGKTGEWQIWVNAERVGRGFHNRLVGHVIPAGGLAITGQEQTQVGGGFHEGTGAPKGSGGMLGEITMVQLYKVALTAGKAHKDHKHHHAHQYDHNGNQITTPPTVTPNSRPTLPSHPLLTGGQLNPAIMLNFAGGQPNAQAQPQSQPQLIPGQDFNAQLFNGQFVSSPATQQFSRYRLQPQFARPLNAIPTVLLPSNAVVQPSLIGATNIQLDTHQLFKRGNDQETSEPKFGDKIVEKKKRQTTDEKPHKKRELYLAGGTIIESLSNLGSVDQSLLYGLAGIGDNRPIIQKQQEDDEREPAEAEVKAVLNVCSGCDEEPFEKALVFGWRTVPKKLYSGAFYSPATPQCRVF